MDAVAPADRRSAPPSRLPARMNAGPSRDAARRSDDAGLAAAHAGAAARETARWVWHGPYGPIVIEVIGDGVYVDGDRVEPYRP
jgi:hypothetical protein